MLEQADSQTTGNSETVYGPGAAHLGVAWCLIRLKNENYKERALKSFKNALLSLSNEMSLLNTTQLILEQKQIGFVNSDLYKQLNIKATILGSYLNGIQGCIDAIKRSLRLIDVVATERNEEGNNVLEKIQYFYEQAKNAFVGDDLKLNSKQSYSLTFNHLTRREDCGTKDQAVLTLENATNKRLEQTDNEARSKLDKVRSKNKAQCLDKNSYSDIKIKLKQVDWDSIKSTLFNPDKEFKDLTKEAAIMKLKEERTYCNALHLTSSFKTNLQVISTEEVNVKKEFEDKQINELLEIIEDQPSEDTRLRFHIVIKKSNENKINKLFKSSCKKPLSLDIDFENLDHDATKAKLSSIKAKLIHLQLILNKLNLLTLLKDNGKIESCKLFVTENLFDKVNRVELFRRVNELKMDDSPCYVRFENLQVDQAKKIIESCPQTPKVLFGASFIDVYDIYGSDLGDGQVNFSFGNMNCETAKMVIEVLRKENFEFCFEFMNLNENQLRYIVKHASLEQEDIDIRKVKSLSDSYMKGSIPSLELAEFAAKGIEHIIEINEKPFVPWRSVTVVAIMGSCQVIVGGVLMATGFGTTVGMALVTEGLADLFTAYRAYSTREFHWSNYCKQKAISLVISAMSAGYSKLKEGLQKATKGVQTLTTGVCMEGLEQAGTQIVSKTKEVGQIMIQTGKNLKTLTYKYVGVKAGEAVTRECLNTGIQYLSNFSFELVKPKICESIQSRIRSSFSNTDLMSLLRKMHAIDKAVGLHELQSRVERIVTDAINPQRDFARRQWDSIGLPLLKGILSDSNNFGSAISMSIRICGTLNGLYQVQVLVDYVVSELITKLKLANQNSMAIHLVLHRTQKMDKDNAQCIVNKLKILHIFDETDNFEISHSNINEDCGKLKMKIDDFVYSWRNNKVVILEDLNCKSNSLEDDVDKSIRFLQSLYDQFVRIDLDSFSEIIKTVSDKITEQLIRIIDSQMIQPWSTMAVSCITDSFSKRLQDRYLVDKKQNSDSHNEDQKKYDELKTKKDLTTDEITFIKNYGKYRTFTEQINYNAKDYCIAYSQCEMAYYATKKNNPGSSNKNDVGVEQAADDIRNGKAANVAIMLATAKISGINLKVVNEKSYVRTQDDIDKGVEVVYVERGENNKIGHAYYMNNDGQFVDTKSEGYDCFYAALSSILESRGTTKSILELRSEAAQQIGIEFKKLFQSA